MNNIDIWNDLGNLYLKANATSAAINAFTKAIDQGYQSGEIYNNLAGAYVTQGNIIDSIPIYLKSADLLSDQKQKAVVFTRLGDCYRRIADYDKAIAAFRTAIDIEPGNPALCVGLGEVQRDLEKIYGFNNINNNQEIHFDISVNSPADPCLDSVITEILDEPASTTINEFILSEIPFVEGLHSKSYSGNDLVSFDGTHRNISPDVKTARIVDTIENSRADENILTSESYSVGFENDVDDKFEGKNSSIENEEPREKNEGVRATLLLTLGIMHWRNGDLDDADGILQTAVEVSVKIKNNWFEALSWHALALVKTALGDIVAAINAYLKAVELAPEQIFPWNNLGSLYGNMGCTDKALAAYQTAIKKYPEDSTSWDGLGDIYTKMGRIDDAIAAYQLGNVFGKRSQGDNAIKVYEKAFDFYKFTISSLENQDKHTQEYMSGVDNLDPGQKELSQVVGNKILDTFQGDLIVLSTETTTPINEIGEGNITNLVQDNPTERLEVDEGIPSGLFGDLKVCDENLNLIDSTKEHLTRAIIEEEEESQNPNLELAIKAEPSNEDYESCVEHENLVFESKEELTDFCLTDQVSAHLNLSDGIQSESIGGEISSQNTDEPDHSENEMLDLLFSSREQENSFLPKGNELVASDGFVTSEGKQSTEWDKEDNNLNKPEEEFLEEILPPIVSFEPNLITPNTDPERISGTIASYEAVVRENPRNDRAWDSLGNLYRITQRNKDAIYAFERAVLVEPKKYLYHYQLSILYAAEENYDDAIYEIEKVIELNPSFNFAHCALASYFRKCGREVEAQEQIALASPFMAKENEYDRACFESICGNVEKALGLLTLAIEKKLTTLEWIRRDSDLDFIRDDPSYKIFESKFSRSVVEY